MHAGHPVMNTSTHPHPVKNINTNLEITIMYVNMVSDVYRFIAKFAQLLTDISFVSSLLSALSEIPIDFLHNIVLYNLLKCFI